MIRRFAVTWQLVMSSTYNPLKQIPKMQRFQLMQVLAYMWSLVFAAWAGSALIFGVSVIGHSILLLGIFFTTSAFHSAAPNKLVVPTGASG